MKKALGLAMVSGTCRRASQALHRRLCSVLARGVGHRTGTPSCPSSARRASRVSQPGQPVLRAGATAETALRSSCTCPLTPVLPRRGPPGPQGAVAQRAGALAARLLGLPQCLRPLPPRPHLQPGRRGRRPGRAPAAAEGWPARRPAALDGGGAGAPPRAGRLRGGPRQPR